MTPLRLILVSALLVFAANAGIRYSVIAAQKAEIAGLQEQITGIRQAETVKRGMREHPVFRFERDLQQVYAHIPDEGSFSAYAIGLRNLIDQHQLTMDGSLMFLPADTPVPALQQYNTRLRVSGPYTGIKQFIAGVMNQPGLVFFNAMRFEKHPEYTDIVRADMELSIFFTQGRGDEIQ